MEQRIVKFVKVWPPAPPIAGLLENKPFLPQTDPDPVHAALLRRLDAVKARRLAAALSVGSVEDQRMWTLQVARAEKLTRVIIERGGIPF